MVVEMEPNKEETKEEKKGFIDWIVDHKTAIIGGVVLTAIGALGIAGLVKINKHYDEKTQDIIDSVKDDVVKEIPVPEELSKLGAEEVIDYGKTYEFMTGFATYGPDGDEYPAKVAAIDTIKDILLNKLPGVDENSPIYMLVNVAKNTTEE